MNHEKLPPHGGDITVFETEYGYEPLDFSANVNPLGISGHVCRAISESSRLAFRYPDPYCRNLRRAISQREGIVDDQIYCGNGASDIIYRLAKALTPGRLLITAPTFSEYETAFSGSGWTVSKYFLKESKGFKLDDSIISLIDNNINAVILCEPNNPTGIVTDREVLVRLLERCRQTGTILIIDECFNGFLDNPDSHTMKDEVRNNSNLIIINAFTKLHGMAGIRLGYCLCGNKELPQGLYSSGPPWNVSSIAQAAGIAALSDESHIINSRQIVRKERHRITPALRDIGIAHIYGQANFLLFKSISGLDRQLMKSGILIRNCSNYAGLEDGWYRIAVKTAPENARLITTLKEILT